MAAKESTTHAVLPQVVAGPDLDRRAVLYSRVSTLHHGQDPEVQSREIREYCQRRGWPLVGEYVDAGISGAKERRPQLDRLIADAHKRKFEVIVVWKFDRFARSVSHLLRALENFRALGIEFVSLSEQIDTVHAHRQNDFHRAWRCGGVGAQPNCGAGAGWLAQRPRQGQAPG